MILRPLAYLFFLGAVFLAAMSLVGCESEVCGKLIPCGTTCPCR